MLGRLVASMVNVINPARIVLGGAIDVASDDLLAGVRSGVYNRAMPLATRNLTLAHSVLGPVAGVVGGAVSAIEHILSPEGLTHALTTGLHTAWRNRSITHNLPPTTLLIANASEAPDHRLGFPDLHGRQQIRRHRQ